jgi:DNA mismatch repair ATPase MutS
MVVHDSLESGVSFFLAELKRLREVVTAAEASQDAPLCYLLDEVLLGTDSVEREIAVERVLARLCRRNAIGAVSTHDRRLGSRGELAGAARPVHFQETLDHRQESLRLTFDYRLHPGVATTTNALRLLGEIGLTRAEET